MAVAARNSLLSRSGAQYPLQAVPKVMFDEDIEVVDFPASLASAEKDEDVWYTNSEYFFMRRQATNMSKRINHCDEEEDCSRGLEIVESTAAEQRNKRIQDLVQAVIQRQGQSADAEELAAVSRKASEGSMRKSLENAIYDEKQAIQILSDTRKAWRRKSKIPGFLGFFSR